MLERTCYQHLIGALDRSAVVIMTGPRQVGKTTLARQVAAGRPSVYLDLERPSDLVRISDVESFCAANRDRLVVLDEVQRTPEIFAPLRAIVDEYRFEGRPTGHFLLLGSASLELLRQSSETLAGRSTLIELGPVDAVEYPSAEGSLDRLWLRGGFPLSLLADDDDLSLEWRREFVRSYLERDVPQFGFRVPAETLRRLWTMLSHGQATTLNLASLAAGLGISGQSVARYVDLLVDLLLVRRLPPLLPNLRKRLTKSPKVLVRDSGIVHALLGLRSINDLLGHPVVGGSWEAFVIENLIRAGQPGITPFYFRTQAGAEIDLVLELEGGERWAIEIKRSLTPKVSKGFYIAADDIEATRRFVVYPGAHAFSLRQGVIATPLPELMRMLRGDL